MPQTLGSALSHRLHAHGVDTIFGIPGVHNVELYRGIEEAGITHVLARHEQGAGFMADGYARASGKPGVAYVISGPGLTNIMTPMGQAYSDHVPMLVVSSCLDETAALRGQLHQMRDQRGAAETVCAWSEEAKDGSSALALIDRALAGFAFDQTRPAHLQVPIEVLGGPAPTPAEPPTIAKPGAGTVQLAPEIAALVTHAKRPMFILGGGATSAWQEARRLVSAFGAASFTTYAGRGIIAGDDPLYYGANLARPASAAQIAQSDLVICIGSELAEVDLWRHELGHKCPMIRVDRRAEVFADRQENQIAVQADAAAFLDALAQLAPTSPDTTWDARDIAAARASWRAETDAERPGIVEVAEALHAALPDEAMIFSDMTQLAYVAKEVWDMPRPGLWHHPFGFGTLGYALPAAIGGRMACSSDQPVIAMAGDYGFQYTIQELGTAVELGCSLPIILWDNGKLKEIEDSMTQSQITPNAVIARNPDFGALARAYGAEFAQPASLDDIAPALSQAIAHNGPTIIRLTPALTQNT